MYQTITELMEDNSLPEKVKEDALVEFLIAGRIYEKLNKFIKDSNMPKKDYQLKKANEYISDQI